MFLVGAPAASTEPPVSIMRWEIKVVYLYLKSEMVDGGLHLTWSEGGETLLTLVGGDH
jgi:hypothetical protein